MADETMIITLEVQGDNSVGLEPITINIDTGLPPEDMETREWREFAEDLVSLYGEIHDMPILYWLPEDFEAEAQMEEDLQKLYPTDEDKQEDEAIFKEMLKMADMED